MSAGRKRKTNLAKRKKMQLIELGIALCACITITTLAFKVTIPVIPEEWIWRIPQILFPIAVVLARRGKPEDLGLTWRNTTKNAGLGILIGVLLTAAFLPFIYTNLWSPNIPTSRISWDVFFYTICAVLITVIPIEIFYRGYIQPRFEAVVGFPPGLVLTSLLCGLDLEYKVLGSLPVVIIALVFGFSFKRTRSLMVPIIAHFTFILLVLAAHVF